MSSVLANLEKGIISVLNSLMRKQLIGCSLANEKTERKQQKKNKQQKNNRKRTNEQQKSARNATGSDNLTSDQKREKKEAASEALNLETQFVGWDAKIRSWYRYLCGPKKGAQHILLIG